MIVVAGEFGLGVDSVVFGGMFFGDKVNEIEKFCVKGLKVVMVGDGINDVFVFVIVDVGIVMFRGMEVIGNVVGVIFLNDVIF